MHPVENLKIRLKKTSPKHDTPIGLFHPYWARKPFNIVKEIILALSSPGDVVVDPFMGSGTTVFAATSSHRNVIASDISPLSKFIVSNVLELRNEPEKSIQGMRKFLKDFTAEVLPFFVWGSKGELFIERERYEVQGDFSWGQYTLHRTEYVLKKRSKSGWIERSVVKGNLGDHFKKPAVDLQSKPIHFSKVGIRRNPRIAVPHGAKLSHYFTDSNQAAINVALRLINGRDYPGASRSLLRLLLSSALPLLRLSDAKASSQWPFWRPKKRLTSRNPVIVLEKRLLAFEKAAKWLTHNIGPAVTEPLKQIKKGNGGARVHLIKSSIQELIQKGVGAGTADLVLTDPPYADQAPYLEYAALWTTILGLTITQEDLNHEVVKSDAPDRQIDSGKYLKRLEDSLSVCSRLVKPGGYVVWFYQDRTLKHWSAISSTARKSGLQICDVIPLPKQRRSLKTVASPGRTLDGDLLLVFKKAHNAIIHQNKNGDNEPVSLKRGNSLFEKYVEFIRDGLKNGSIEHIQDRPDDVIDLVESGV